MRNAFIFLFLLFIISCKEEEEEQNKPRKSKNIPNALQEKSVDVSELTRREKADLIEVLYNELIQKDPSLKQLEKEINSIQESKADSLKPFTLYDQNNSAYYTTYENHLKDIQDSLLRLRMKKILDSSLIRYKKKYKAHQNIADSTNAMYNALSDLHWLLKLTKTLAVMENYQDENMPDTLRLKRTMELLNNAIIKADSLAKQKPVVAVPAE